MVQIRFEIETPLSPETVLATATDFSERRPEIWSDIDPAKYRVHASGAHSADVTEGGKSFGGIWARERYDWSTPGTVTAEVQDSNIFRSGSRWELRVRPAADGGSRIEWTSIRRPNSLKGLIVVLMLRLGGRRYLSGYLRKTLARLEREQAW
jgi:hypothetical protein